MISISNTAFEADPRPMLVLDGKTERVLVANAAACRSLRTRRDVLLDLRPEAFSPLVRKIADAARAGAGSRGGLHVSDVSCDGRQAYLVTLQEFELLEECDCTGGESTAQGSAEQMPHLASIARLAARLRQTQSLAEVGHWELNVATGTVCWSLKTCEIFGELPQTTARDQAATQAFVHPADRSAREAKLAEMLQNRGTYTSIHRIVLRDGQIKHVRELAEPSAEDENIIVGITQDVTDYIVARSRAERTAALIEDAGNIAKVGGWEYDPETQLVTRTPMVAQIVGHPDTLQITLDDARGLYTERFKSTYDTMWRACLQTGERFDEVMEIVTQDGTHKWVRISGKPIWNADGTKIASIRGALQDITEVVQARQENAEMSLKLEETLEAITDSFMVIDHDWILTFANKAAEELIGLKRSEMVGRHIWSLFPESKDSVFHRKYEQVFAERKTQRFVAKSQRSGKWLYTSAYPTSHGLAIAARDVTQEQTRDKQLSLLETAVARLNDIVMIAEATSQDASELPKFVFANEAVERVTGFSPDETLGKTAAILRGVETQPEEIERLRMALEENRETRSEIINYTKSGEQIWLDLDVVPIRRDDGSVTHWVSVARDITERKRNEQRIAQSEERFRLVASATNDVIWDCDLTSGQMWWNDKIFTVFGYDPEQFEDRMTWWDANIHPDEQEDVLRRMKTIIEGTDEFWVLQYRFRRADGSFADVRDHGAVLRDENGVATRILGNMTDITEQLRLEAQLLQSQKMEAIGKLTGGIAHDFNNLLAVIMGNLELLRDEAALNRTLPDDTDDLIQAGIAAVKRGSDLTRKMLSYARKATLAPIPTDLNAVVLETESWVRRTINSNIEITTRLDAGLCKTLLDPNSLQNALVNLLLNARDAMKTGGAIFIETRNVPSDDLAIIANDLPRAPNGYVMLSVSDNGAGIAQGDLERVCDPFFTTKPVGKGSGLGLSMVQGFVSQSGGEIRIFSEADVGTTVMLFFNSADPVTAADYPAMGASRSPRLAARPAQSSGRVLLAEDEPDVSGVLVRSLRNAGYDVTVAATGDAALTLFQSNPEFDLLLTDVSMPGRLDGQGLAEACWSIRPDLPVLFLTGHPPEISPSETQKLKGCLRLMKPLSRRDLLAAVESLVSS